MSSSRSRNVSTAEILAASQAVCSSACDTSGLGFKTEVGMQAYSSRALLGQLLSEMALVEGEHRM